MRRRKPDAYAAMKAKALRILRRAKRVTVVEWGYDLKREYLRVIIDNGARHRHS